MIVQMVSSHTFYGRFFTAWYWSFPLLMFINVWTISENNRRCFELDSICGVDFFLSQREIWWWLAVFWKINWSIWWCSCQFGCQGRWQLSTWMCCAFWFLCWGNILIGINLHEFSLRIALDVLGVIVWLLAYN